MLCLEHIVFEMPTSIQLELSNRHLNMPDIQCMRGVEIDLEICLFGLQPIPSLFLTLFYIAGNTVSTIPYQLMSDQVEFTGDPDRRLEGRRRELEYSAPLPHSSCVASMDLASTKQFSLSVVRAPTGQAH